MAKEDNFPIITTAHLDKLLRLSQQDRNELITAILLYAKDKTISELDNPLVEYLFNDFIQDFDERKNKYEDKCVKLRSNASKGGKKKAIATKCYQLLPIASNCCQLLPNATPAPADSPLTPNYNIKIKEEDINKGNNYTQSENILSNDNNSPPSYNTDSPLYNSPSKKDPTTINSGCAQKSPPRLEAEPEKNEGGAPPPSPPRFDEAKLCRYWNKAMQGKAIRPIQRISGQRRTLLTARINEYGKEAVQKAIDKAAASDFLNGGNDRGWVLTFDWFVRPNNFPKVLEGNYDNKNPLTTQQYGYTTYSPVPNRWEQQQIERQQRLSSYSQLVEQLLDEADKDPTTMVNILKANGGVLPQPADGDGEPQ